MLPAILPTQVDTEDGDSRRINVTRRIEMAKYLVKANYTQAGLEGLLKDGGSKRRAVTQQLAESLGGKLEAFYYAFGDTDLFAIVEFPDNVSVATASLVASAAGGAATSITVLLTAEEVDEAAQKSATYTAPGN
jgi:uncharacterized protein with GYD domain